ncbi:glycosyltransferase family 39 protein [Luedemannella helvata]|uniref:Glycosyltransferase RgtA/B/C/D-like domain-containing protein n=1 Tax=Luedemannella helvata TaxID=349315 RepID=A0ABP4X908_9ACTN
MLHTSPAPGADRSDPAGADGTPTPDTVVTAPEEPPADRVEAGRHARHSPLIRLVGRTLAWSVPAAAMLIVGLVGITQPVLGWDEMATWSATQRPVSKILSFVANFDGVLAPYYLFMHWWTGIFGTSHLALRAPSLIAMAVSAALVARLGTRLIDPFGGLIAGLLFVAVPAVSRYAQDARPYGFAVLFATLATLLLLRAIERPTPLRWLPYALSVALLGLANILALLLLVGHAVAVVWRFAVTRDRRLLWWAAAVALGLVPAVPLIVLAMPQHDAMLAWIHVYDWRVAAAAPGDIFGATVAGLLIIGVALAARPAQRWVLATLLTIAIAPTAALLLASIGSHVWVPRYVLFTVVAWVLLAAFTLRGMPVRAVFAVVVVTCVALPAQFDMRGDDTHVGPDNRLTAEFLRTHAEPGDAIIYAVEDLWSTRNGIEYYMGDKAPRDVLLFRSRVENDSLKDTECPDAAACIGDTKRLWVYRCANSGQGLAHLGSAEHFLRQRTVLTERYSLSTCTLRLYVQGGSPSWPSEPMSLRDPDADATGGD